MVYFVLFVIVMVAAVEVATTLFASVTTQVYEPASAKTKLLNDKVAEVAPEIFAPFTKETPAFFH
jgi:hypothetical protein